MRHRHICRHYLSFSYALAPASVPVFDREGILIAHRFFAEHKNGNWKNE
jgi:hypothetical protein